MLPGVADLGRLFTSMAPVLNQPNEHDADVYGCISVLDTGFARSRSAYRWTEEGGLFLLDFFKRLEDAGGNPFGFGKTHPPALTRIPVIQATAWTWQLPAPRLTLTVPRGAGP